MSYKTDGSYTVDEIKLARFAKAIGHPARVQILKLLSGQDSCFCGNIVDILPLSQSTVSQHLKELKDAGLVKGRIDPPKVYYCIDWENWELANKMFSDLLQAVKCPVCV